MESQPENSENFHPCDSRTGYMAIEKNGNRLAFGKIRVFNSNARLAYIPMLSIYLQMHAVAVYLYGR